jgi:hypothetical protein
VNELTVRQALATRLGTISGLTAYPRPVTQLTLPAAEVGYPEPISYSDVMGGRRGSAVFPVKVLVSHLDRDAAEATLAGLLDEASASSVPAVLDADPSLGGAVESAQAVSTRDYGLTTISGDIAVLAVDVLVEVYA